MNTITTYKRVLSYGGLSTGLILMIVCFIKDSFLGGIIVGCIPLFLLCASGCSDKRSQHLQ